jgi:outer membrane lipoprotein-sorting protein
VSVRRLAFGAAGTTFAAMRSTLLALAATLAALALPASARELSLDEISKYLNGLQTATADFTQVNDDGSIATGKLYIKRPGRVRFEYNPPDKSLVMAGGSMVAIFDGKSNQPPEQYPLKQTPLSLILERNVDLARRNMVVGHNSDGKTTTVVAQDPDNPDYGTIRLVFTDSPVELRQWLITDGAGGTTTVILGELSKGADLPASLFSIDYEAQKRGQ